MDRHPNVFFSDEDVARVAKGRIFLGDPLPDGDGTLAKMPTPSEPIYVLPTADQYRSIRVNEERRGRLKDGLCATAESLLFVYDESSAQDKPLGCSDKKTSVQENTRREVQDETLNEQIISCRHTSNNHSQEEDGNASEDGLSDDLISRSDENEKYELKMKGRVPGSSEKSHCDSWLERVSDVPAKRDAKSRGRESSDSNMNHSYDLYSEKSEAEEDEEQSSEEEISDALISSDEDGEDDEGDLTQNGDNNMKVKAFHATSMPAISTDNGRQKIPSASCEAIGRPITKTKRDHSGDWHDRRSVATLVLSRIKRKRSLLKRPRGRQRTISATGNSNEGETAFSTGGNAAPRRTTLRFAAARKKQANLRTMFKK